MKINREIICLPLLAVFLIMITGTAIAEEVNVELVSHLGGVVSDVVVDGNYAYIGQGQDLVVLDISDESNPSEVGRVITPSMVNGVAVAGNCVYLLENYDSLVIVDITNPSSPKLAGRYDYDASSIVVAGDYLYLGVYNGFDILDITNPFSPRSVGEYRYYTYPATYGNVAAISGNYAYLALNYYNGLSDFMIVDISSPSSPTLAGSYRAHIVYGVAISGNYAYITDYDDGLIVLDITNSSSPMFVSSYSTGYYGAEHDVAVSENYAYIADGGNGLTIVNVIDPSSPKPVSSYNTGYATEIIVSNNHTYVVNSQTGLAIVDVTDTSTPKLLGSYNIIIGARDVVISGNYAYLADESNGLSIIDITDPYLPKFVGRYLNGGTNYAVAVSGDYAYLASEESNLVIVDISNPSSPKLASNCYTSFSFYSTDITITNSCAFIAYNGGIAIVDIANPLAAKLIGSYKVGDIVNGVAVEGNYAYAALRDGGFIILDITNPAVPDLVGKYSASGSADDIAVSGNHVYLANGGLSIVDVSDRSAPSLVAKLAVPAQGIEISGNLAYVSTLFGGLYVVDITNATSPTIVAQYTTAGVEFNSFTKDDYVYVADGGNGLVILKTDISNQASITVGEGATTPEITQKFIEACDRNGGLSVLGNPTMKVHSAFGFEVQDFPEMPETDGGVIMYNPNNNTAYFIHGAIWDKYYAYPEKAKLGAVASDEGVAAIFDGKTKGNYTKFETGTIHWISDRTGENVGHLQRGESFFTYGALDKFYTEMGGTYSDLGFPIMDQITKADGYDYCMFEGGSIGWDAYSRTYKVNYSAANTPPTTTPVFVTNTESSTPTISWTYRDADNDPQQQYELEVWSGMWQTGTKMWSQSQSSMYSSVTYGGLTLEEDKTYYARVRAFDGISWSEWSETSFISVTAEVIDTGFSPKPNGYQFSNFRGKIFDIISYPLPWEMFRYTYGSDIVDNSDIARIYYDQVYSKSNEGGNCFGMSASSLALYKNNYRSWDLGDNRDGAIPSPKWDIFQSFVSTPADWIKYYQGRRSCPAISEEYDRTNGAKIVFNEIKNRMSSSNWKNDPMVITYSWWSDDYTDKNNNGKYDENMGESNNGKTELNAAAHTVVPFKIVESLDHRSGKIYVYDSNHPGKNNLYFDFDLIADTVSPLKDGDNNNEFLKDGGYDNNYRINAEPIHAASLTTIEHKPDRIPPFEIANNVNLIYTDVYGYQLGKLKQEFVSNIKGAFKVWSLSGEDDTNGSTGSAYYIPEMDLKREVIGLENGTAKVTIFKTNAFITVELDASKGSVDQLNIPKDCSSVGFVSGNGTSSLSLMLEKEGTSPAQIVRANISQIEAGSSIDLSNVDGDIIIKNSGLPKTCSLYLEQMGVSPNSDDSIKNIVIEEDSTVFIEPLNWNDIANSQVIIEHDVGSDGSIDSTEIIRPIKAEVTFDPETFSLNSTGEWVTAYIELPAGYNASDIDIDSVLMNDTVPAVSDPKYDFVTNESEYLTDLDLDGISERMFKFNRGDAARILKVGDKVTVTFTGKVEYNNGVSSGMASFEGSDVIKVTDSKNKKG